MHGMKKDMKDRYKKYMDKIKEMEMYVVLYIYILYFFIVFLYWK